MSDKPNAQPASDDKSSATASLGAFGETPINQLGSRAKEGADQASAAASDLAGQAQQVGAQAAGAAKDVAGQAAQAASAAASQIKDQAAGALEQGKSQIADKLEELAQAAQKSGEQFEGHQDWAAGLIERGAQELGTVASTLRSNDLGGLISNLQGLARRQPLLFAGAAAAAGFALVRFGKVAVAGATKDDLPNMPDVSALKPHAKIGPETDEAEPPAPQPAEPAKTPDPTALYTPPPGGPPAPGAGL